MNYLPRDIRQIILMNGDEILTEVLGEDDSELLIRNPLKVHKQKYAIEGVAKEANMFSRWMGFAENDEMVIVKDKIIAEAIVNDMVAGHYNRMINNVEDESIEDTEGEDNQHPDLVEDIDYPTIFH